MTNHNPNCDSKKDPFRVLNLDRGTLNGQSFQLALEIIKKAYKKAAAANHPDRNDAENAAQLFIEASTAYTALTDPIRLTRGELNEWDTSWFRSHSKSADWQGGGATENTGPDSQSTNSWDDFFYSSFKTGGTNQHESFDHPIDPGFNQLDNGFCSRGARWRKDLRQMGDLDPKIRTSILADSASRQLSRDAAMLMRHPVFAPATTYAEAYYNWTSLTFIGVFQRVAWGLVPDDYEDIIPPETFAQTALFQSPNFPSADLIDLLYKASFYLQGADGEEDKRIASEALLMLTHFMRDYCVIPSSTHRRAVAMELLAHFSEAYQASLRLAMDILKPGVTHTGRQSDRQMEWEKVVDYPYRTSQYAVDTIEIEQQITLRNLRRSQPDRNPTNASEQGLDWAIKRARKILQEAGQNTDSTELTKAKPPFLFQFKFHNSPVDNLGFDDLLSNPNDHDLKNRATPRSDSFIVDPSFVAEFLYIFAEKVMKVNIFSHGSAENPDFLTGRFKDDNQMGFVVEKLSNPDLHKITLVTPDIERTKKAFQALLDNFLVSRDHLISMLTYGYNFSGLPHGNTNLIMDRDFKEMLASLLGISRPKESSTLTEEGPDRKLPFKQTI
jgi:hypothetical protein